MCGNTGRSKTGVFVLGTVLMLTVSAYAQTQATTEQPAPFVTILDSTKEQDGLIGSVRRVTIQSAKLESKAGRLIEGPRQVVETTTYGLRGDRISNVSYPVVSSPLGKEEYKYDDKGNIIEMTLRGDNGSILSREAYDYEFDRFGNWTKMVTSLVVFEASELKREPVEVTYRTIAYYFDDTVAKIVDSPSRQKTSTKPSASEVSPSRAEITASQRNQLTVPDMSTSSSALPEDLSVLVTRSSATEKAPLPADNSGDGETNQRKPVPISPIPRSTAPPEMEKTAPPARNSSEDEISPAKPVAISSTPTGTARAEAEKTALPIRSGGERKTNKSGESPQQSTIPSIQADTTPRETDKAGLSARSGDELEKNGANLAGPLVANSSIPATATTARTTPGELSKNAAPSINSDRKASFEYYKTGRERFDGGDFKAAVEAYRQSIQSEPNSAEVWLSLGQAYLKLQKDGEALKAFEYSTRLNPDMAEAHYGLGLVYFRMHRNKNAADAFKRATLLAPRLAKAHYGLALAYQELGKQSALIEEYRILETLDHSLARQLSRTFPEFNLPCRVPPYCK